jgi:AcrR family transcriptional regulator
MTKKTEEKIMGTALGIFARKGYLGAKTKFIAEEAGFSEMTLFRKFKTKKNLYDRVMEKNQKKISKEFKLIFSDKQYKTAEEFLKNLIENISNLIENNFEYIVISIHEGSEPSKSGDINSYLIKEIGQYIGSQDLIKSEDIDFEILAFNIVTFMFFTISDKKHGKLFDNHDEVINKFIAYSTRCIGH